MVDNFPIGYTNKMQRSNIWVIMAVENNWNAQNISVTIGLRFNFVILLYLGFYSEPHQTYANFTLLLFTDTREQRKDIKMICNLKNIFMV